MLLPLKGDKGTMQYTVHPDFLTSVQEFLCYLLKKCQLKTITQDIWLKDASIKLGVELNHDSTNVTSDHLIRHSEHLSLAVNNKPEQNTRELAQSINN